MSKINILIIGSGGREHAMGWKLKQSSLCGEIFFAPGNGGTSNLGTNINRNVDDFEGLRNLAIAKNIRLLIPGSEEPLVKGIYDYFQKNPIEHLNVLGPSAQGAALEGSKHFAKLFMQEFGIPTAAYRSFHQHEKAEAIEYLSTVPGPYVLKADGLAAGKGVIIESNLIAAQEAIATMLDGQFGSASQTVVVEQFLSGIEASFFVLTDGKDYVLLPEAKDYKRIGEGDTGLNTGGMGAVSPVPFADEAFIAKVKSNIIEPTIRGLQSRGIDYKGFIFFGLIKVQNEPFVIEYNVRMGDPETQIVLARLDSDLLELLQAAFNGRLNQFQVKYRPAHGVCITLASAGYPGTIQKGIPIKLDEINGNGLIFHAGTASVNGELVTSGGRVLSACALGETPQQAIENAYSTAARAHFEGKTMRHDIGRDLIK